MSTPLVDLYQVRLFHAVQGITHVYKYWGIPTTFSASPGGAMGDYSMQVRASASRPVDDLVEEYLDVFSGSFFDDSVFPAVELWRYEANSLNGVFLSAMVPTEQPSVVGTAVPASSRVYTARTTSGRIAKLVSIEGRTDSNSLIPWEVSEIGSSSERLGWWFTQSADSWMVDREGGFPIAALRLGSGQNEAVWRKRYRP